MTAPQIDFYVLDRHVEGGRMRAACRLCRKIQALGHRVFVQTPGDEQTAILDDLMWTFEQGSFVPHGRYAAGGSAEETPVAIGRSPPPAGEFNVLVSLLDTVPECYEQFHRVVELVDNTDEDKARARERYRWYRDRGCNLQNHELAVR